MLIAIASEIRVLGQLYILAAELTEKDILNVLKTLSDMINKDDENDSYFDSSKGSPMAFSEKGTRFMLSKFKGAVNALARSKGMESLMENFHLLVEMAAKNNKALETYQDRMKDWKVINIVSWPEKKTVDNAKRLIKEVLTVVLS